VTAGSDLAALQAFFHDQPSLTVALEATTNYTWMYDTLETLGHTVQLAHPLKVRAIASARIKTDRIDAGILCDLLRGNLLPTSYVPPPPIRALRELLRHRIRLVHDRTRVKNRLTVLLAKTNQTVPGTDPFGVKGRALLAALPLPPRLAWQREDGVSQLEGLNGQIKRIDVHLRDLARDHPEVPRLTAIPGIGIFSALLLLAALAVLRVRRERGSGFLLGWVGVTAALIVWMPGASGVPALSVIRTGCAARLASAATYPCHATFDAMRPARSQAAPTQ
jgi:transposase